MPNKFRVVNGADTYCDLKVPSLVLSDRQPREAWTRRTRKKMYQPRRKKA